MTLVEVKAACMKSLEKARLGIDERAIQDGKDFYKYMFGHYPDLRIYFKGAENFTPDDVQKSDRFAKQGQRILLACHILANTYDDPDTFKAYARETVNRHRQFKMEPSLWSAFFTVFIEYLATKDAIDDASKKAWQELGKEFSTECLTHLKNLGLPH
ncbi:unnamed protein product [Toxocara canis]|uniref:Globin-like protein n=2 Tax=Toxocara canis TaxID=6265 RepID=A0A183VG93_TOXCA|nr:unnamed protein product [Toxocara canis]